MFALQQIVICVLLLNYSTHSATPSRTYRVSTGIVKLLENVPSISKDPISEIATPLDRLYTAIGIRMILNGNSTTNGGPVTTLVRASRPTVEDAKYYYHYALAVHCESSLEQWDCYYCKIIGPHIKVAKLISDSKYHTKVVLTVDEKKNNLVIAFRSSYNVGSTLTSLLVSKEQPDAMSDIKIHSGAFKSVEAVYREIVLVLLNWTNLHPTYKVIITGHSLGGQQASVLMFLLKYRNLFPNTVFELYTFGQPRTGNKAFADFMNNLTIPIARVVNARDVVTRVHTAALGYYHHQNELYLTDDGNGTLTSRYCSTQFYEDSSCGQGSGLASLLAIDHIVYFGIDPSKCLFDNPVEFLLQYVWPLRPLIPRVLLDQIPSFAVNTTAVLNYRYLVTAGVRNLYRLALKSSTYVKR